MRYHGCCSFETFTFDGSAKFHLNNVSFQPHANIPHQPHANSKCSPNAFDRT